METHRNTIIYGLNDKPPMARATVLGLQHVLTMFGSTVAVPLILPRVRQHRRQRGYLRDFLVARRDTDFRAAALADSRRLAR